MLQAERQGGLDVAGDGPGPAGQAQVAERARLGQGEVGPQVGHLVEQEREAGLGLGDAELAQVEVDHRLAELGQVDPGRLDAVAVGHVEEVDPWHGVPLVALLLSVSD